MSNKDQTKKLPSEEESFSPDSWLKAAVNAPLLDLPQSSISSQDTLAAGSAEATQEAGAAHAEERYQRQEEFARGGLGRIVKAYDRRLSRPVALKELLQRRGHAEERFLREAMITARLQHPAIVPVYDAGRGPEGEPFYAMKMVEGRSFDKVLEENKTLAERLALLPHIINVAEAMAYAHSQKIIHRDLKPNNILVGEFGETVVIDWGLAKDLTQGKDQPEAEPDAYREVTGPGLTTSGSVMGTPAYMPPEQAQNSQSVDARADVYSLGAILYQLLSGLAPYQGKSSAAILHKLLKEPPVALEVIQPKAPKALVAIVEKAMQREAMLRYPSAAEVAIELKKFQTGQLVEAYQYTRQELIRRWLRKNWVFVFAAVAVLFTLVVMSVDLYRTDKVLAETKKREQMAKEAKEEADKEKQSAETREKQAREYADNVAFEEAKLLVHKNPVKTLELLAGLSEDFPKMGAVRIIAADALSQKSARIFRGGGGALVKGMLSANEKELLALEEDGTLWRFSLSDKSQAKKSRPKEMSAASIKKTGPFFIADFSLDGRYLAFADTEQNVWLVDISTSESKKLGVLADWASDIKFSPNGALLAATSGSNDGFLWEVSTGRSLVLKGHFALLMRASFSPEGNTLATASADGTTRLWDLSTLSFEKNIPPKNTTLIGHTNQVQSPLFSPNGKQFATASIDGTTKLWELSTGKASQTLEGNHGGSGMIGFSPNSELLFSFGLPRTLLLWRFSGTSFERRWTVSWEKSEQILWAGFAPTGELWYGLSKELVRFNPSNGTKQSFAGHEGTILYATFSKDGNVVISFGEDGNARLWSIHEEQEQFKARFGTNPSPGKHMLAFCENEKEIRIQTLAEKREKRLTTKEECKTVELSPDEKFLAATEKNQLELWELSELQSPPKVFSVNTESPCGILNFSPDSRWLVTSDGLNQLWILDRTTGQEQRLAGHTKEIFSVSFSPDSKWLASSSADETLRLWDLSNKPIKETQSLNSSGRVFGSVFSADGRFLAFTGMTKAVGLLDRQSGQLSWIPCGGMSIGLSISPDSRLLAVGNTNDIVLWDLEHSKKRADLRQHQEYVYGLSFSPDSSTLSSASLDGTVRLWDVETGESRSIVSQEVGVFSAPFLSDGKSLLLIDMSGKIFQKTDDLPHQAKELLSVLKGKVQELRGDQ
jgi:WD40 repeat protein/serine/threonine protein kinase